MATYTGKYPKQIKGMWRDTTSLVVLTNEGMTFRVYPKTPEGKRNMPRIGQDIRELGKSPDHAVSVVW